MQVTLAKALKVKNQTAGKIAQLRQLVQSRNVVQEINKDKYDVRAKITRLEDMTVMFVMLKKSIAEANAPIQPVIAELSEVKSELAFYQSLNTDDATRYDYERNEEKYYAHIKESDKDAFIMNLEKQIVRLQDSLDEFNATTKIWVEDSLLA